MEKIIEKLYGKQGVIMYEKVEKIINDWDLIELFFLVLKDEYS